MFGGGDRRKLEAAEQALVEARRELLTARQDAAEARRELANFRLELMAARQDAVEARRGGRAEVLAWVRRQPHAGLTYHVSAQELTVVETLGLDHLRRRPT